MDERWMPVKGYECRYEVSDMGRVRSLKYNRIMTPTERRHGYLAVMLYGNGGHATRGFKSYSVHRLVAEAFLPNPDGLPEVNHIDENKQNNSADNLEWVSHQQNCVAGTVKQRLRVALTNGKKSKPICQYTLDGELVKKWPSLQEASRNGYAAGNISKCANGHPKYGHAYGFKWRYATSNNE